MNGKGSLQRRASVSGDEFSRRWDDTFHKHSGIGLWDELSPIVPGQAEISHPRIENRIMEHIKKIHQEEEEKQRELFDLGVGIWEESGAVDARRQR